MKYEGSGANTTPLGGPVSSAHLPPLHLVKKEGKGKGKRKYEEEQLELDFVTAKKVV